MKRVLAVVAFVLLFCSVGFCAEDILPAVNTGAGSDVVAFAAKMAIILGTIIGNGLMLLIMYFLHKWTDKIGFEKNQAVHAFIDAAVDKGVHYAEEWAAKQATKPIGNVKLQKAGEIVEGILGNDLVVEYGKDKVTSLIEAFVHKMREKSAAKKIEEKK